MAAEKTNTRPSHDECSFRKCNMLDISNNRNAVKYPRYILIRRIFWTLVEPIFRFSPRISFGWRCWLLRRFGAKIGKAVHIYGSAKIYMPWNLEIGDQSAIGEWALIYSPGKVRIGEKTTISQRAHICAGTHDYTDPLLPLIATEIVIGNYAWVCADAYVGPGVNIGEGAVVGARAVVVKNVEPWTVVAGNPAKVVKRRVLKSMEQHDDIEPNS